MSSTAITPPFMPHAAPLRRRGAWVVQRLLTLRRQRFSRARWQAHRDGWRRLLNLGVAASALLLFLPLLLVIAAAVKCSSPGTVFYTQPRVGLNRRRARAAAEGECRREHDHGGRVFTIIKFRTMHMRTSGSGGEDWARAQDPRVTPIGAVLRKHRLDELPQFLNVVRGEMNIVGPRPEQPAIFRQLTTVVDGYARRQRVLPGITGWAQIHQRPDQCIEDVQCKVALDLQYLRRRSAAEDLRIMLRTVPVMLRIGEHTGGPVGGTLGGAGTQEQGLRDGE